MAITVNHGAPCWSQPKVLTPDSLFISFSMTPAPPLNIKLISCLAYGTLSQTQQYISSSSRTEPINQFACQCDRQAIMTFAPNQWSWWEYLHVNTRPSTTWDDNCLLGKVYRPVSSISARETLSNMTPIVGSFGHQKNKVYRIEFNLIQSNLIKSTRSNNCGCLGCRKP